MKRNCRWLISFSARWIKALIVIFRTCGSKKTSNSSKIRKGVSNVSPNANKRQTVVYDRSPPLNKGKEVCGENQCGIQAKRYCVQVPMRATYLKAFISLVWDLSLPLFDTHKSKVWLSLSNSKSPSNRFISSISANLTEVMF